MFELSPMKTVRYIAYYFITACIIGLLMHIFLMFDIDYTFEFKIFVMLFIVLHGVIGIGISTKKQKNGNYVTPD